MPLQREALAIREQRAPDPEDTYRRLCTAGMHDFAAINHAATLGFPSLCR